MNIPQPCWYSIWNQTNLKDHHWLDKSQSRYETCLSGLCPFKTAAHFVTFKCFCSSPNNVNLEKVKVRQQKGAGLRILRTLQNWSHNPFLVLRKINPMKNPITLINIRNMLPKFQKLDNKSFFRVLRKNRH